MNGAPGACWQLQLALPRKLTRAIDIADGCRKLDGSPMVACVPEMGYSRRSKSCPFGYGGAEWLSGRVRHAAPSVLG